VCESVLMKTVGRFGNPHSPPVGGGRVGGSTSVLCVCGDTNVL